MGEFKFQARTPEEISELVHLAREFEARNAFCVLMEGTSEAAARALTQALARFRRLASVHHRFIVRKAVE